MNSDQGDLFDEWDEADDGDDVCRNRHGGNPESEEANLRVDKRKGRGLVLRYLAQHRSDGGTADEIAAFFALVHNAIAPRMSELKRDGVIVGLQDRAGNYVRRKTRAGCSARVFILPVSRKAS